MRKIAILIIGLSSILFITSGLATENLKIGILDIQKLINKTGAANKSMIKINNKYAEENKALIEELHNLHDDIKKFNRHSAKLKPQELEKWQRKIDIQQKNLSQKRETLQKKIIATQNLETQELVIRFLGLVSKIALNNNLDLVLFKDVILYKSDSSNLDLTNETIKLYAKKPKIK
ncbi:MAG: OmpH family outer membrane protein [Coxiellaceae bacterium]|jgi:outer membrane protein|nr:OmpH family outer membrane protein [Coxiellaceae bacterium]